MRVAETFKMNHWVEWRERFNNFKWKVRFVCLLNSKCFDGAGGIQHMYQAIKQQSGKSYVIDTDELFR